MLLHLLSAGRPFNGRFGLRRQRPSTPGDTYSNPHAIKYPRAVQRADACQHEIAYGRHPHCGCAASAYTHRGSAAAHVG